MSFIALLICLGLERFWDGVADLRYFGWFDIYKDQFNKHLGDKSFWQGYVKVAVLIVPILLIAFIVSLVFSGMLGDLGSAIFSVLVLAYCIGPGNLYAQVKKCVIKGEDGQTILAAEQIRTFFGLEIEIDNPAARLELSQAILTVANRRIFAVCFWFGVLSIFGLGAIGALLYRLVVLCESEESMGNQGEVIQSVLDWPAARVLSFAYAITGNFIGVFPALMRHLLDGLDKNSAVLKASARAAFGIAEDSAAQNQEIDPMQALHLLDRALVSWVLVILVINIIF